MVFAAGLGSRMRPLTDRIPKPLVRVAGKALVDYTLDALADAGVETAIVNVHHLADQIETHLASRREPRILISDERELLLDQGGGIKKALPLIGDAPFFICNTDAFWRDGGAAHVRALASAWRPSEMDILLLLARTQGNVGVDWAGDFDMDADGRLSQPAGKRAYVYAGVGVISPELFRDVEEEVFRLSPYFFSAAQEGRLFGVAADAQWLHVGSIAAIDEAERVLASDALTS
jgi:MurNAc alpha-1-phosphate uridylyltransferase